VGQVGSLTPRWDSVSNLTLAWLVGPNKLCREGGGGALVGGKFRAYSAAKAAGYAFRPFILRIRHAQAGGFGDAGDETLGQLDRAFHGAAG
jgi:hypothetical protein